MKASTLLALSAATGLASAQSLSLSTGCMNSLQGVLTSPDAACLNPAALLSFFVGSAQSVPDTVNNWLTGLCSSGFCSNDTLAEVVANVTTGCASDFDISDSAVVQTVTQIVQEVYPTARSIVCLQDDTTNQLCVTETLNNLQNVIGSKLSFSDLNIATAFGDFEKILTGAKNLACTGCTKAAFRYASQLSLVSQDPSVEQQVVDQIDAICGANFIENSTSDSSDGVSQTAVQEAFTSSKPNGALSLTTTGRAAGAALMLFFSVFMLL